MKSARMMEPTTRGLPIATALVIAEIIFFEMKITFLYSSRYKERKNEKKRSRPVQNDAACTSILSTFKSFFGRPNHSLESQNTVSAMVSCILCSGGD